jgi:translation initiation factor 2B subunit (eIF-2B alpha/beta/delta family)
MVAITHALRRFDATLERSVASDPDHPAARVLEELELESHRAVETAAEAVRRALITSPAPSDGALDAVKHVVVFSRSSTLVSVLRQLSSEYRLRVTCSKSSPGDEGEIMAQDLVRALLEEGGDGHTVSVAEDATLLDRLWWAKDRVHAVLVGADCILPDAVYNKVGTNALAEAATAAGVPVICCGDSFKTWDDSFPPPLEEIFEAVPRERFWEVVQ